MAAVRRRRVSENVIALQRKRDHNAERAINRLPAEVLSQIFEHATDDFRDTWPSEARDDIRLVVSGVCSWWRAIAVSNPVLWGILIYQDTEDVTLWSRQWTLLCLSRSGDADLDVSVSVSVEDDVGEEDEEESIGKAQLARLATFMDDVKTSWNRVASLIFQLEDWNSADCIFPLPHEAPRLRHFEIDLAADGGTGPPSFTPSTILLFPRTFDSLSIALGHSKVRTVKITTARLSGVDYRRLTECFPKMTFLRIQNLVPDDIEPPSDVLFTTPLLENLILAGWTLSCLNFDAPALQSINYELLCPSISPIPCWDFFPRQFTSDDPPTSSPVELSLGDVSSTPEFVEPALRLLRSYSSLVQISLRGKEGVAKLLAAAWAPKSPATGSALIAAPGASPWIGLAAPPALRRLDILAWEAHDLQSAKIQLPDPKEQTQLAEVLLEILNNSPELETVKWWSLHDPTTVQHPDFDKLKEVCRTMVERHGERVSFKLAI